MFLISVVNTALSLHAGELSFRIYFGISIVGDEMLKRVQHDKFLKDAVRRTLLRNKPAFAEAATRRQVQHDKRSCIMLYQQFKRGF